MLRRTVAVIGLNRGEHAMTCLHAGRQFIALTVGGETPALVALALP